MIGTIRKHSSWLWWIIAGLTIVSFVYWGVSPATRNGGGRSAGFGTLYGKPVTPEAYAAAQREFYIYYWLQYHEFPDKNPNFTKTELEKETYIRLLLTDKAKSLGVYVGEDARVAAANDILRSLDRSGQPVPFSQFLERVLQPAGLGADDFQRFVGNYLTIQQLVQTIGLNGALVTPQEAAMLYDRQHQEVSAQAVFFSATNFLSQVTVTPAAVAQFYTNTMAVYRLPDRVQINYVQYDLTNFLAAAEQKLGKTNLASQVESYYLQHGKEVAPDAKTPEEGKAKIREMILRQAAGLAAVDQAREFARELFAMEPVSGENLVTLAKKNGLTVHTTAPFTETEGPEDFPAPAELTKTAFKLNEDSPFSKPISGAESVYVIGLAKRLPSAVQPLDQIRDRVVKDFQFREAALKAQNAGSNFYFNASVQMAAGKTFAQAAIAAGQTPVVLKPFSLSSQDVPEVENRADVNLVKQAAFGTQIGHLSPFVPTDDGGFVLLVQSMLPLEESAKITGLPKFVDQMRRGRESEAFNLWLQSEANRELRDTPVYAELTGGRPAPGAQ